VTRDRETADVLGWLDDQHLATRVLVETPGSWVVGLARADISTGERTVLVTFPKNSGGGNISVAVELLALPTRPGVRPPRPIDPRLLTGGAVALAVVGGRALLRWRRRAPA